MRVPCTRRHFYERGPLRPRRTALVLAASAGALTLVTACGAASSGGTGQDATTHASNESSAPPRTELIDAIHALRDGSALTTTLSLDTTTQKILGYSHDGSSAGLTEKQANLIATATITVETTAPAGKTLADATAADGTPQGAISVTGAAAGKTYFTLLVVDQVVYAQLDLQSLLLDATNDGEPYSMIVDQTSTAPAFVKDFIAGKFVSLPISTIKSLSDFMQGYLRGADKNHELPSQQEIADLRQQVLAAIGGDLTVARTATGDTDSLVVTGNLQNIARDVLSVVASGIPQLKAAIPSDAADMVPNLDLKANASVTGGLLSKLSFDLGQFDPASTMSLPIVATFVPSSPTITAPADATPVNLQALLGFAAAAPGGAGAFPVGTPTPLSVPSTAASSR